MRVFERLITVGAGEGALKGVGLQVRFEFSLANKGGVTGLKKGEFGLVGEINKQI